MGQVAKLDGALFFWLDELVREKLISGSDSVALGNLLFVAGPSQESHILRWLSQREIESNRKRLIVEHYYLVSGNLNGLIDSLETLPNASNEGPPSDIWVWNARFTLRIIALIRTLPKMQAQVELLRFQQTMAAFDAKVLEAIAVLEATIPSVRVGHYAVAIPEFQKIEREICAAGGYWEFRLRTVWGTCLQAMGNYSEAKKSNARLGELAALFPNAQFYLTWIRRRISLSLESERYGEAADQVQEFESYIDSLDRRDRSQMPLLEAQFWQEKLRLHLVRDQRKEIGEIFSKLEGIVRQYNLPISLLTLIEERAEVALRSNNSAKAAEALEVHLRESQLRGDLGGQCVVLILLARSFADLKKTKDALLALQSALSIADRYEFGKARVRALFYYSAISRQLDDHIEAELALSRAEDLAIAMNLPIQRACIAIVKAKQKEKKFRIEPLLAVYQEVQSLVEVLHYLEFYGFDPRVQVSLRSEGRQERRYLLSEFVEHLFLNNMVCWIRDENFLINSVDGNCITIKLDPEIDVHKCLKALLDKKDKGMSLEEIHGVKSPRIIFHPQRHNSAVHSLIARVRSLIEQAGLNLEFKRERSRYYFTPGKPIFVATLSRKPVGTAKLTPRQKEILSLFTNENPVRSTTEICESLGITRQTLHPMIGQLVANGKLRLRRRGRSSSYIMA